MNQGKCCCSSGASHSGVWSLMYPFRVWHKQYRFDVSAIFAVFKLHFGSFCLFAVRIIHRSWQPLQINCLEWHLHWNSKNGIQSFNSLYMWVPSSLNLIYFFSLVVFVFVMCMQCILSEFENKHYSVCEYHLC